MGTCTQQPRREEGWLSTDTLAPSPPPSLNYLFLLFTTSLSLPFLIFSLLFALSPSLILFASPFPQRPSTVPLCSCSVYNIQRELGQPDPCYVFMQYHMKSSSDRFWWDCLCPRLFFWGLCVHKSIQGLGLNESIYTWPEKKASNL